MQDILKNNIDLNLIKRFYLVPQSQAPTEFDDMFQKACDDDLFYDFDDDSSPEDIDYYVICETRNGRSFIIDYITKDGSYDEYVDVFNSVLSKINGEIKTINDKLKEENKSLTESLSLLSQKVQDLENEKLNLENELKCEKEKIIEVPVPVKKSNERLKEQDVVAVDSIFDSLISTELTEFKF